MARPGLWPGADVRWVGPDSERDGVRLRPGDRAVVVDPGRHALQSMTRLYHAEGAKPAPPRRGVVVRLAGGATVRVARRHLELVGPEHPLAPEPDGSVAEWFLRRLRPWRGASPPTVASFVPDGFPAVARVLHPWTAAGDPSARPVRWSEVAVRSGFATRRELAATREATGGILSAPGYGQLPPGELDRATARELVDVLTPATSTPGDVFFAVWIGWAQIPPERFPGAAVIPTEGRGHFLLRGPLDGALASIAVDRDEQPVSGIWWPADRAWMVATEIDFEWTFVAGSDRLVDQLLSAPGLEVTRTSPDSEAHLPDDEGAAGG